MIITHNLSSKRIRVLSHWGGVGVLKVAQLGRWTAYLGLCPFTRPLFWCLSKIFSKQTCDPSKSEKIIAFVLTAAQGVCLPTCPDPVSTCFFAFTFFFLSGCYFFKFPSHTSPEQPWPQQLPCPDRKVTFPPYRLLSPLHLTFSHPHWCIFPPLQVTLFLMQVDSLPFALQFFGPYSSLSFSLVALSLPVPFLSECPHSLPSPLWLSRPLTSPPYSANHKHMTK